MSRLDARPWHRIAHRIIACANLVVGIDQGTDEIAGKGAHRSVALVGVGRPEDGVSFYLKRVGRTASGFELRSDNPAVGAMAASADAVVYALRVGGVRPEDLALDALDDTMTRERFEAGLAGITPPDMRPNTPLRGAGRSLVLTPAVKDGLLPDLAAGLLAGRFQKPSLWSAVVNEIPRLIVCEGLPQGPDMLGLFNLSAPIWSEAQTL